MKYLTETEILAGDISVSVNGPAIKAQQLLYVSAQSVITGASPVGNIKLQVSNDPIPVNYLPANYTPTNWSDVVTVAVAATGVFLVPKTEICNNWVRIIYARTSGAGAITTIFNAIAV